MVNSAPKVPKLYASGGLNIAKSIEGGNMKLTILVNYMYMRAVTNAYLCNKCIIIFLNHIFRGDLVKTKPLRYCIELLV